MEKTFPIEKVTYNGVEYVNMRSDIFYLFFKEINQYTKNNKSRIEEICKQYECSKNIKRKRIRFKKEKQALLSMYYFMVENLIN